MRDSSGTKLSGLQAPQSKISAQAADAERRGIWLTKYNSDQHLAARTWNRHCFRHGLLVVVKGVSKAAIAPAHSLTMNRFISLFPFEEGAPAYTSPPK